MLVVIGVLALVLFVVVQSLHPAGSRSRDTSVNLISDGSIDGVPFHKESHDDSSLPLGPDARKAFALVSIGQAQEETLRLLGNPIDSHPMDEPNSVRMLFAYHDGWIDLIFQEGRVWLMCAFGPYLSPTAYPPIQSDLAERYGRPVQEGNWHK